MACELEQQSVDMAVMNLQIAQTQRAADAANLQQSTWAEMAAQIQLMMALMLLQNCLNGGGILGLVAQMEEMKHALTSPEKFQAKISDLHASVKKLKVGK